jgi:16S rRNA (guanine527-N7)-methyltransferase
LEHGRSAAERCGGRVEPVIELSTPGGEPSMLVIIAKVSPTPAELPRRPGMPAKRPLR